jgi:hypothetical protein
MSEQTDETLYCYNHPNRPTLLRCNQCNRPICTECAVLTPTGYRCKECVRGQQKIFITARWYDYPIAAVFGGGLALAGSLLASLLGFFILFVGPVAGVIIAEVIRFLTGKRRSWWLGRTALIATAVGAVLLPAISLIGSLLGVGRLNLFGLIWAGAYTLLVTSTMYYRLTGIRIG